MTDANPAETGLIDPTDVLVTADDRLLQLNASAGGAIGAPLALPPVLTLTRLARRLGIPITRPVLVADTHEDVELLVTAEPMRNGAVRLHAAGWRERPMWEAAAPLAAAAPTPANRLLDDDFGHDFSQRLERALRRPLGRIIANADSISVAGSGAIRQEYTGYAADIAAAGRHLLSLVGDLVDLDAIEQPDFAIPSEDIDLADVARRAAGLLAVRASTRRVRINPPAASDTLPVRGEFRRALQVLVNLIGNAVHHSPPDGVIWMRLEREGDAVAVIVADQGRGIDPADQARIFDKFVRIDADEMSGSGLGLYIARRLARAMGGDILVDSAPGQGARFIFTLPARD